MKCPFLECDRVEYVMYMYMYVQVGVQNATHTHTLSLIVTHMIVSHSLTHSLKHIHTHTHTHARTHARTHAHAHTHAHTHARTTHTRTHTHTPPPHPDILTIAVSNSRSTAHFVYMLPYCAQVSILHSPQQFVAHDGHSPNKPVSTAAHCRDGSRPR